MRRRGVVAAATAVVSLIGLVGGGRASAATLPAVPKLPMQLAHGAYARLELGTPPHSATWTISVVPNPIGISLGAASRLPLMTWHVTAVTEGYQPCVGTFTGDVDSTGFSVAPDLSTASLNAFADGQCGGQPATFNIQMNWVKSGAASLSTASPFVGLKQLAVADAPGLPGFSTSDAAIYAGLFVG